MTLGKTVQHRNWQFECADEPVAPVAAPPTAAPQQGFWGKIEGGLNKYDQTKQKIQSGVSQAQNVVKNPSAVASGAINKKYGNEIS